jgi:hypothetical protein
MPRKRLRSRLYKYLAIQLRQYKKDIDKACLSNLLEVTNNSMSTLLK